MSRVTLDPEAISAACHLRGWDIADLASAAGLSHQACTNAVRGKPINVKTFSAICRALKGGKIVNNAALLKMAR